MTQHKSSQPFGMQDISFHQFTEIMSQINNN